MSENVIKSMDQTNKNIIFYEICRLCLDERGCCNIFDKSNLRDNIYNCIGLKISLSDTLPQKVCGKCLDIVDKATELRKVAYKNDVHLRSLFYVEDEISVKSGKTVNSQNIDENIESSQKHPAIQKFIKVREDLFESSCIPQESSEEEFSQKDNSQKENPEVGSSQDVDVKFIQDTKQYKCEKCQKVFDKSKKLYLHSRLHNKNFSCPIQACKKKFATKGDLEKHIRTHTGEKPYKCDVCGKGFSQRGSLKSHKESVHARHSDNSE